MPQLNPAPWFAILVFSWLVLLTIVPPKVMSHTFSGEPDSMNTQKPKPEPWNWPWH